MLGVSAAGPCGQAPPADRGRAAAPAWNGPTTAVDPGRPEREAWAVLTAVDGLGPAGMAALLAALGDGRSVLATAASPGGTARLVGAAESLGYRLVLDVARRIADSAQSAPAFFDRLRALGLTVVTLADEAYPGRLRRVEQPPPVLFVAGDLAALDPAYAVAIVGTRRPTERGRRVAAAIAGAVAGTGAVVVSGLAIGIDGVAHGAAVDVGGRTVAVLGGGHARLYPRVHARLAFRIAERSGAVISELAPDVEPIAGTFPRRNRVISGLSDATIVVEARARSGALITAGWALEQGRPCFAVPGPVDVEQSLGCNRLLRLYPGEARAVATVEELLEDLELGPGPPGRQDIDPARRRGRPRSALPGATAGAALAALTGPERTVAAALLAGSATVDDLVMATGMAPASVLVVLTRLEDRGYAAAALGRYVPAGPLASAPLSIRDRG